MFIRIKRFRSRDSGLSPIVESYRDGERIAQRVLCTLGRLERLQEKNLEVIQATQHLVAEYSKEYGVILVFKRLFELLGLKETIEECLSLTKIEFDIVEATSAMILSRILEPQSERATHLWLDEIYDEGGKRPSLHHLYRSLDFLAEHKNSFH